jgi:hypothetical protein
LSRVVEVLSVLSSYSFHDPSSKIYLHPFLVSLEAQLKSGTTAELRDRFLGAFGAFLTILTLAFHTLIQNAISTRSGMLELDALYGDPLYGASYPQGNNYTMRYNDYSTYETLGDQGPTLDMVADITYGMYYTMMYNDTQTQLSIATCLTGNCTWRHIQTLGVCSKCADITSKIYDDTHNGIYTLYGNAVEMDQRAGLVTSLGNTLYPDPSVLPGVGPLIVHVTTMARANTSVFPTGIDCALYWCVVDQSNVIMTNWDITDAVYTNWTDPSTSAHTTYKQRTDIQLTPPTCYDKNARPISDTTKCTKTVSSHSQIALQNYFTGEKTGFTGMATQNLTTGGWNIGSEVMQLIYTTARISDDLATDMGIIMNNIGLLMTSNIRQTKPQNGFAKSLGEVWIWTTLYHIRWGYMVLPTLLVVASILFLIATIIKSWGHEKWKSSVLPLLFHPLADEVRPGVAPHKMSELKAIAENREVRLHRSHLGSQFV